MAYTQIATQCVLATISGVDMATTATKRALYTVPAGFKAIISDVIVSNPSATLGSDNGFGFDTTPSNYNTVVDLSASGAATSDVAHVSPAVNSTRGDAAQVFGIIINTGAAGGTTADITVMGTLF